MSELKTNLQSILQEKTEKIISQNIKKNVEVLGVTGSYDKEDIKELEAELADAQNELATVRRDLDNSTATISGNGEIVTLNGTAEARFKKPPLPMGNSEQDSTTGANIFNLKKFLTDRNVPYTENTDGSLTFAVSGDYQSLNSQPLQFSDTDIAVSLQGLITLGTAVNVRIEILDSNNNWTGQITSSASKTENRTASKIRFNWGDVGTVTIKNVMLNIGSTAQPYEPYTNGASPSPDYPQEITNVTGDVEVVVKNKNLFNKNTVEDGKYINNVGEIKSYHTYVLSDYIAVKPSTQYSYQGISGFSERLGFYDKDKNLISVDSVSTLPQYQTITTPSNCYYFRTTVLKVDVDAYQFEESSTPTNRVEHKSQTFTFPLGNEKLMLGDYLADDGIHHVKKQVVFDGTEEIFANTSSGNIYAYIIPALNKKRNTSVLSNYFIQISEYNSAVGIYSGAGLNVCIKDITTVNDFKAWLSTHNTIVEYELETEEIIPYTSAQETVYNAIKEAISYEEQTNISGSSSGSNPIFIVIALRNMNDTLNTLENEIELLP